QWSAVAPSPSAAFTSAFFAMAARRASRSEDRAASITGGRRGPAANASAEQPHNRKRAVTPDSRNRLERELAAASADLLHGDVHLVHDRDQEVGDRRLVRILDVAPALEPPGSATGQQQREVFAGVAVAIRNARTVHEDHVVEQGSV